MRDFFRLGPLTFDDKKRALPLQAADLLAYEVWKHQGMYWGRDEFLRERERENTNFEVQTPDGTFTFNFNSEDDESSREIITPSLDIKFD
jgi:hypothetical protein